MRVPMVVLMASLFVATTVAPVAAAPEGKKKVLVTCLSGSNDPTRATLCLVAAVGLAEAGHQATLTLLGEAAYLASPKVSSETVGVGLGKVSDWMAKIQKHKIPVFV